MKWQDTFDKSKRPNFLDLKSCLSDELFNIYNEMNHQLVRSHHIKGSPAHFNRKSGWVFPYCINGIKLFSLYILDENSMAVDDIPLEKESDLQRIYDEMNRRLEAGFSDKVNQKIRERKERALNKKLSVQDSSADNSPQYPAGSTPELLNKFHWTPAVRANSLRKLYHGFTMGITDTELLDDIGLQFYVRCVQGTEEYGLLRNGKVKCHNCGAVLDNENELIRCQCGYQYTLKGYIASFNENRMPGGNAQHIFIEYIDRWPKARTDADKLNTVDWLIHQCHVSMASGLEMRSVLKNLIDAPTRDAKKLINDLAYGKV